MASSQFQLRGEKQEHRRHGQVVDQRGNGKAAVDKFFKGDKQAQGVEHRAEGFGQPAALEQKQRRKRHAAPRKGKAAQRKAFAAQPCHHAEHSGNGREQCQRYCTTGGEHGAQTGHHIGQQQRRHAGDSGDDLVFGQAGKEHPDGNGGAAHELIAQQGRKIGQRAGAGSAQCFQHKDHARIHKAGQRKNDAKRKIFAQHDAAHRHRAWSVRLWRSSAKERMVSTGM